MILRRRNRMTFISCSTISLCFVGSTIVTTQLANGYIIHNDKNVLPKLVVPVCEPPPREAGSIMTKPEHRTRSVDRDETAGQQQQQQNDDWQSYYHERPLHHDFSSTVNPFPLSRSSSSSSFTPKQPFLTIPSTVLTQPNQPDVKTMPVCAEGSAVSAVTAILSPLESWCISKLDIWYSKSQSTKCPFLRRRWGDVLDTLESVMKYTIIRKECWPYMGPPQALRPAGTNKKINRIKYKDLSLERIKPHILDDWKVDGTSGTRDHACKGYYVTGKLTTAIYRDDCWFLGPDPDMPIHGLRKYVGVAAHLFDYDASFATLHSLDIVDDNDKVGSTGRGQIVATWTLGGILRLPWKPRLPTFSGQTVYHIDDDGLIYCHEESWDLSVMRAFCHTLFPDIADRIWSSPSEDDGNQ